MKTIIAFLLFLSSTTALQLPARVTVALAISGPLVNTGIIPAPTTAPSTEELRKRQLDIQIPGLVIAPDITCGYRGGDIASPVDWLCDPGRCAFATTAGATGNMYCCGLAATASCEKRWTACVDSSSISALCGGQGCDTIETVLCSSSDYPYCGRGVFEGLGVSVLYCASTQFTGNAIYYTSFIGGAAIAFTPATTSSPPYPTSTTTTLPITPIPVPVHKTPTGAIVGGTIGGVAVIAAIVIGILFFRCFKKGNKNPPVEGYPQQFVQHQVGGRQGSNAGYSTSTSPSYSKYPVSPQQQYSSQPEASPVQYHSQHFVAPQDGTTSPRPGSTMSNPVWYPAPMAERGIHEAEAPQ